MSDKSESKFGMMQAELALDCRNAHGEGILFNQQDGLVWWTDIDGHKLWSFDPVDGQSLSRDMPERLCAFAPRSGGGFLLAFASGIELWDADWRRERRIHEFEPDNGHTRLNDGRTDRWGNFVVGGMNEGPGHPDSSVVRVRADQSVETLISGVSVSNSTCFSQAGDTLYFTDTPQKFIRAYPYGQAGVGEPTTLIDLKDEDGFPDGSCIDSLGGVWNALWEGGAVIRVADGQITHRVSVPVSKPTCCAFGGDNLETLFITTSRQGHTDEQIAREPLSGSLFAITPGFKGLVDAAFAG